MEQMSGLPSAREQRADCILESAERCSRGWGQSLGRRWLDSSVGEGQVKDLGVRTGEPQGCPERTYSPFPGHCSLLICPYLAVFSDPGLYSGD